MLWNIYKWDFLKTKSEKKFQQRLEWTSNDIKEKVIIYFFTSCSLLACYQLDLYYICLARLYVALPMCISKRERESEWVCEREKERVWVRETVCICMCVCVWERERERKREIGCVSRFHLLTFLFIWDFNVQSLSLSLYMVLWIFCMGRRTNFF